MRDGVIGDVPRRAVRDLPDGWIVAPGFVDVQVNGFAGAEVGPDADALATVAAALPRTGVTAFCPTLVSRADAAYRRAAAALARARVPAAGARPLGVHLEGPFLNAGAPRRPRPGGRAPPRPRRPRRPARDVPPRDRHPGARAARRPGRRGPDRPRRSRRRRGPHGGRRRHRPRRHRRRRPPADPRPQRHARTPGPRSPAPSAPSWPIAASTSPRSRTAFIWTTPRCSFARRPPARA